MPHEAADPAEELLSKVFALSAIEYFLDQSIYIPPRPPTYLTSSTGNQNLHTFWKDPSKEKKDQEEKENLPSLVEKKDSKAFAFSSYQLVVNRVQRLALEKARCKVPSPEEQLALLSKKNGKGKEEILSSILLF